MLRFYKYLFYKFYNSYTYIRNSKEDEFSRSISTVTILSVWMGFTIILLREISIFFHFDINKLYFDICFILQLVINGIYFLTKERYAKIISYFNTQLNETLEKKQKSSKRYFVFILLYFFCVAISIILLRVIK